MREALPPDLLPPQQHARLTTISEGASEVRRHTTSDRILPEPS